MADFFVNLCEFQAVDLGKVIDNTELRSGLYLLKEITSLQPQVFTLSCVSQSCFNSFTLPNESEIMLWHSRLGHPNFGYL